MKVEAEIRTIYVFAIEGRTTWMGHYDPGDESCSMKWARTIEELYPYIARHVLSRTQDYYTVRKVKVIIYNNKPFIPLFENFPYSDFMDYVDEETETTKIDRYQLWEDIKVSDAYKQVVQDMKDEEERKKRKLEQDKIDAKKATERKEIERLKELQKKYPDA